MQVIKALALRCINSAAISNPLIETRALFLIYKPDMCLLQVKSDFLTYIIQRQVYRVRICGLSQSNFSSFEINPAPNRVFCRVSLQIRTLSLVSSILWRLPKQWIQFPGHLQGSICKIPGDVMWAALMNTHSDFFCCMLHERCLSAGDCGLEQQFTYTYTHRTRRVIREATNHHN